MPEVFRSSVALGTARTIWLAELRSLGALALPIVLQTSAQQGMTVTDQVSPISAADFGAAGRPPRPRMPPRAVYRECLNPRRVLGTSL